MNNPIKIRANAMRLASILANMKIPSNDRWKKSSHVRQEKEICQVPPISNWPEIDMDPLLVNEDEWFCMADDGSMPAVWPVDVALAVPNEKGLKLVMTRSINLKLVRGVARRISQFNVEAFSLDVDQYGAITNYGGMYLGRFNKQWSCLVGGGTYASGGISQMVSDAPAVAIGVALRHRYEWSALFSFSNGFHLRFGCSAQGILEILKDREKGDDETRRRALLHWVRKHWRKISTASAAKEVRQHLRGVAKCNWRGMDVSVVPAEYELEQVA